jgi:hypothetical protein
VGGCCSFKLAPAPKSIWNGKLPNLPPMDCEGVGEKWDNIKGLRTVNTIFSWEGIQLAEHHKWFESCLNSPR